MEVESVPIEAGEPEAFSRAEDSSAAPFARLNALATRYGAPVTVGSAGAAGKGAFARRPIVAGEMLWIEVALVALRHAANTENLRLLPACGECSCWLGTTAEMLESIAWAIQSADEKPASATPLGSPPELPKGAVACPGACGVAYCSAECQRNSWAAHHRLLCTGCGNSAPEKLSKGQQIHRGALLSYARHAEEQVLDHTSSALDMQRAKLGISRYLSASSEIAALALIFASY
eukprot:SAG11_NODE_9563_length_900_cov_1.313358_1_plen_233_part_00